MTAGTATADSDAVRVNLVIARMFSDVSDSQSDVSNRFGYLEPRATAVSDEDQCVASINDFLEQVEIFLFGANYGFRGCPDRDPASADHEQDSGTVGIASGANDIVGQGHPGFMTVDHIRADCSPLLSQRRSDSQSHEEQAAGQKFIHDDRVPVSG